MRLSKNESVQERIRKARCSAVMVRLTAPAEANGPKYRPGRRLRAAMLEDLRRPVVAGDQDIGKRLVVAQLHVEARPQLLDQIGFEQQRLGFGRGRDDLHRHGGRDHAQDARRLRRVDARIGGQPLADVLGLADIEHVVGGVEHAIDAGRGRREPHRLFDRGVADRERAFRHAPRCASSAASGSRASSSSSAVAIAGSRSGSRQVLRRQLRVPRSRFGTAPRLPRGRCFRVVGRIVIHGLNLSAGSGASPARRGPPGAPEPRPVPVTLP